MSSLPEMGRDYVARFVYGERGLTVVKVLALTNHNTTVIVHIGEDRLKPLGWGDSSVVLHVADLLLEIEDVE